MKQKLWIPILCMLLVFGCTVPPHEPISTPAPTAEVESVAVPEAATVTAVPTPTPSPIPTPSPTPMPSPTSTPTPTPAPTPFGIAWLPDTQQLSYRYPEILTALGGKIAQRRETDNLVAVLHTGDIVDNGYKEWQWENFDLCLSAFSDTLPFYPVAGNHDLGVQLLKYDAYLKRPFLEKLPADQVYEGGKMYYIVLHEGGTDLMLLGIGWDCGKTAAEQEWIESVFAANPDTPCILFTHAFLKRDGGILPVGKHLEDKVIRKYPNVRLVLCGHSREWHRIDLVCTDGDAQTERTVPVLMLNMQGKQYLYRIMQFDPLSRSIEIRTYSMNSDDVMPGTDQEPLSFTLEHAF